MRWSSLTPISKVMLQERMLGGTTDGRERLVKLSEKVGRHLKEKTKEMREKVGKDVGYGDDKPSKTEKRKLSHSCQRGFTQASA